MGTFRGVILIIMQVKVTLRHVIGLGLRNIANIMLADVDPQPTQPSTEGTTKPEVPEEAACEPFEPRVRKPRTQEYEPTQHQTFYVAATSVLTEMLRHEAGKGFKVSDFKGIVASTEASTRTACKEMVKQGVLYLIPVLGGKPAQYAMHSHLEGLNTLNEYQAKLRPMAEEEETESLGEN